MLYIPFPFSALSALRILSVNPRKIFRSTVTSNKEFVSLIPPPHQSHLAYSRAIALSGLQGEVCIYLHNTVFPLVVSIPFQFISQKSTFTIQINFVTKPGTWLRENWEEKEKQNIKILGEHWKYSLSYSETEREKDGCIRLALAILYSISLLLSWCIQFMRDLIICFAVQF